MLQERADLRLGGVPGEDLDGAEADFLIVVLERREGDRRHAGGVRGLDDREGLLAYGRGDLGGQDPGDPGQRSFVGRAAQVVQGRVDDDRIRAGQKPLQPIEEVAPGQVLERLHRLPADGFGLGSEEREERRRGGLVGEALQDREPRLAQCDVRLDAHPRDIVGLQVRQGGDRLDNSSRSASVFHVRACSDFRRASAAAALRRLGHMRISVGSRGARVEKES